MAKFPINPIALPYSGDNCYITIPAFIVSLQSSYSLLIWGLRHLRYLVLECLKDCAFQLIVTNRHVCDNNTVPGGWDFPHISTTSLCLSRGQLACSKGFNGLVKVFETFLCPSLLAHCVKPYFYRIWPRREGNVREYLMYL